MQPTSPTLPRESSFELLRILAQFFIAVYHLPLDLCHRAIDGGGIWATGSP